MWGGAHTLGKVLLHYSSPTVPFFGTDEGSLPRGWAAISFYQLQWRGGWGGQGEVRRGGVGGKVCAPSAPPRWVPGFTASTLLESEVR